MILAPEHPLAQKLLDETGRARAKQMIDARAQKGPGDIEKDGHFTGTMPSIRIAASNRVPIWIGNFVLMDYGTGAIMAVPAHDERDFDFCTTYGIPIRPVIRPVDGALDGTSASRLHRRRHRRTFRRIQRPAQRRSPRAK